MEEEEERERGRVMQEGDGLRKEKVPETKADEDEEGRRVRERAYRILCGGTIKLLMQARTVPPTTISIPLLYIDKGRREIMCVTAKYKLGTATGFRGKERESHRGALGSGVSRYTVPQIHLFIVLGKKKKKKRLGIKEAYLGR